jgi:hypothetical protein
MFDMGVTPLTGGAAYTSPGSLLGIGSYSAPDMSFNLPVSSNIGGNAGITPLNLAPGANGMGGLGDKTGTGMTGLDIANTAVGGLQTLGALWMGMKQMKLAKKQFKFMKDISNINLNNQMQSYNTALADRARSRGVMEGQDQSQVQAYIDSNSLSKAQGKAGSYSLGNISSAALGNYNTAMASGKVGGGAAASNTPTATAKDDDAGA